MKDVRFLLGVFFGCLSLFVSSSSYANWSLDKKDGGRCIVQTSFEYKREQYYFKIYDDKNSNVFFKFTRKHRKHIPEITSFDGLLLTLPKGKVINLAKIDKFRIESTSQQDDVKAKLSPASVDYLNKAFKLTVEYTTNRKDEFAHDVETKYLAENIKHMLKCRKQNTKTKKARTDRWRFFKSSAALELKCHAEISTKHASNVYRLIYIRHEKSPAFLFMDQNKADGEIDTISELILAQKGSPVRTLDVDGEFWELNGKEAFYIALTHAQLKQIISADKLSVHYASDKHQSVEQTFHLSGFNRAMSNVNRCK